MKIVINDFRSIKKGYSLHIGDELVRQGIPNLEEVVKEMKKYLRLRFKENIK